jgi:hypothetical protein
VTRKTGTEKSANLAQRLLTAALVQWPKNATGITPSQYPNRQTKTHRLCPSPTISMIESWINHSANDPTPLST